MTASEASLIGIAKQAAIDTENVTDADFKYLLFTEGGISPNNMTKPLEQEVGGGAMLRDVKKMGVMSGGGMTMVPRPDTMGLFLLGALGNLASDTPGAGGDAAAITHVFDLGADQFEAPYFTVRSSPGGLVGEVFLNVRMAGFSLAWKGADFLRAQASFQGGLPKTDVDMSAWDALSQVDSTPPFITPVSKIELPTGAAVKCIAGSLQCQMDVPLEEQWVVGKYAPDAQSINSRNFIVQLAVKIEDATLYNKMMYDPAEGSAWTADIFREGRINLDFLSDITIPTTTKKYELKFAANGQAGSAGNVIWSAAPIGMRAGRQIIMNVTGVFVGDPARQPITATLTNATATY